MNEGIAVAFGPVADPKGAWGVGIVEVDEVLPMPQAIVRPGRPRS